VNPASAEAPANWLLYDGDCPFCSAYVSYVRLRETVGPVALLDARERGDALAEARRHGYDIDAGMLLKLDGRYYHGADCLNALALLTTPSGVFNRFSRALFRSPRISRFAYPVLRAGRNATLALLRRRPLAADQPASAP
jgi:predicted DCC family thiol-disulfide oxidoreductase YuxK